MRAQSFGKANLVCLPRRSLKDVRRARAASADALLLRADFCEQNVGELSRIWSAKSGISRQEAVLEEVLDICMDED